MKKLIPIVLGCAALSIGAHAEESTAKNNVLLIIADDVGIDSLSVFNSDPEASLPPTPTIDNLATNGVTFKRFYGYSTCSPTRGSILTGRYGFRTGITSPVEGENELTASEFTLAEALIESGAISNRVANIGKWHLGGDESSPNSIGGWNYYSGSLGGDVENYYNWEKTTNGSSETTTNYATTDTVDESIAWIKQQDDNPWFLWLAFNAPHTPHHRPPNDLHDYDSISDDADDDSREHFEAMVQAMDTEMGRLLENVDLSKTTVIFIGDNGTLGGVVQSPIPDDHSKATLYEGGCRLPCIITGAAVSSGQTGTSYDGLLHTVDLYSTILNLFEVDPSSVVPEEVKLDSRSFTDVLKGNTYTRSPAEVATANEFGRMSTGDAIIEGAFKYILKSRGRNKEEFYNVKNDISESNNLLDGTLSTEEQDAYDSLSTKLESYTK